MRAVEPFALGRAERARGTWVYGGDTLLVALFTRGVEVLQL